MLMVHSVHPSHILAWYPRHQFRVGNCHWKLWTFRHHRSSIQVVGDTLLDTIIPCTDSFGCLDSIYKLWESTVAGQHLFFMEILWAASGEITVFHIISICKSKLYV